MNIDDLIDKYPAVPVPTISGIVSYVEESRPPGGFLYAVLTNNLKDSLMSADLHNMRAIGDIVRLMYWEVPASMWGSVEEVEAHLDKKYEQVRT
jgi:hypothetical protein